MRPPLRPSLLVLAVGLLAACTPAAPAATPTPNVAQIAETANLLSTAFAAATALSAATTVAQPATPTAPPPASATPTAPVAPTLSPTPAPVSVSAAVGLPFGFGWNVAFYAAYQPASGQGQYAATGFTWVKISAEPERADYLCNQFRLSQNVLLRLNRARAGVSPQEVAAHASEWATRLHQHNSVERCVEAFEIGSAPNLGGGGEYAGPVNPEAYAEQLCAAHAAIKAVDPAYIVVTGGLASTGGEAVDYLDEERFARRMLARIQQLRGNAAACFDAFGVQNLGFRAAFDADPYDEAVCPSGLCFRGAERLRALLVNEFNVAYPLWSTAFGWMRDFNAGGCGGAAWAPAFSGFARSEQDQAAQLAGAFQYAQANWPWMGAMFVYNLDFNSRPWAPDPCQDPDGWFAVRGFLAEQALESVMPRR